MRLGRYVAAEALVLASVLAGATWITRASVHFFSERGRSGGDAGRGGGAWEGRAALLPRGELSRPPNPAIFEEPGGTFLGMSDEMLLARVRTQAILGMRLNKGGSTLSFRVELADGSRAAFKPAQTDLRTIPRKEVAAYRLNRLLGLDAVPPAAPRMVSRE